MPENANPHQSETGGQSVSPRWLVRLCRPGRMLWFAPLLGFVLTLPSVLSGYVQDHHIFRQNCLETTIYPNRAAWDDFHWPTSEAEIAQYRRPAAGGVSCSVCRRLHQPALTP